MGTTAVFTIVAKNYLAHARTLMQSVKAWHPDWRRFVLLVDRVDGHFDPASEDFSIDEATILPVFSRELFSFKYDVTELSTAVKPYYMEYLIETKAADRLIYLDPDIMVFDRLDPVTEALETGSVALTPHLTGPLDDDRAPSEWQIMRCGAYNLGFIAVRDTPTTRCFLRWWQGKLYNDCVVDLEGNLFVDQRWIDLVPGMFAGVAILRDPGLNVAYWNLLHRQLARHGDRWSVNDAPLRFFHFSGLRIDGESLSLHQDRFMLADLGPARAIVEGYRRALRDHGAETTARWPYAFARFSNGTYIPGACRRLVRDHRDLQARFAAVDDRHLLAYFNEPVDGVADDIRITRLAHAIYEQRPDVRRTFPDPFRAHRRDYARWFVTDAARAYQLDAAFVHPVIASLEMYGAMANTDTPGWAVDSLRAAHAHLRGATSDLRARYLEVRQ